MAEIPEAGDFGGDASDMKSLLSKMQAMMKSMADAGDDTEADAAGMLSSILNSDSDSTGDASDTDAMLLKMQSMLKKIADAGDISEGDAQAMLQSAFGNAADASGDQRQ